MRDSFRAYYPLNNDELIQIWADGIIVLDTNTLLNFFRYTQSTRDEFLGVLEKLRESLWIPHHVGLEFHRRRLGVISTTSEAFTKVTESLSKAKRDISATLNEYKHHPSLNRNEVLNEVGDFIDALTEKLATRQRQHHERVVGNGDADQTFHRISNLFSSRVGKALTEEELTSLYEEGKTRYEREIPPGYKDKDDSNPNQYGDLIIWKEILNFGAETKKPVVFVTDDAKEDWWWKHRGKTQGPRVELIDEYWAHAEHRIHFYEPLRFLEYAKEQTNARISSESLEEVEEVSSANSRAHRVLRERKKELETQQAHLLRQLEHRQSERTSLPQRHELREELEELEEQQQALESHRMRLQQQSDFLNRNYSAQSSESEAHEDFESLALRRKKLDKVESHLASLNNRRDHIEGRLRHGEERAHRMTRAWEKRMRLTQEELHEVGLALDELKK